MNYGAVIRGSLLILVLGITGCANPLNRVTMQRYTDQCSAAERRGDLEVAGEACRRTWINTRIGALSSEGESMALYNLGRVQKKALKLEDAEVSTSYCRIV